ncbi:MAG: transposase [Candidatus Levybacteria bacterium]|nr:transposase [Candidatus Levybacteria bacterium]MDZ4227667.1 transposase [Candidatus Levybacteria bacterium]
MPSRNSTKTYIENGYYHIYNRGVEKRIIFLDQQDYSVLLSYLKEYLLPKQEKELYERLSDPQISSKEKNKVLKSLHLNNFSQEITLLAYCLMPNHFHFFIKQKNLNAIDKFMNSLATRYTMYFNRKYKRVGSLYQDVYKAVLINNEGHFLHLSRYIHKQALRLGNQPCSYPEYVGLRQTSWIKQDEILAYFSTANPSLSYRNFVEQPEDTDRLKDLTLEDD